MHIAEPSIFFKKRRVGRKGATGRPPAQDQVMHYQTSHDPGLIPGTIVKVRGADKPVPSR